MVLSRRDKLNAMSIGGADVATASLADYAGWGALSLGGSQPNFLTLGSGTTLTFNTTGDFLVIGSANFIGATGVTERACGWELNATTYANGSTGQKALRYTQIIAADSSTSLDSVTINYILRDVSVNDVFKFRFTSLSGGDATMNNALLTIQQL